METQLLQAAKCLSVGDRLDLVEAIWDSIAEEAGMLPLTEEQVQILDTRLEDHRAAPTAGEPWEALRSRLVSGRG